jgi:hypothetical protein
VSVRGLVLGLVMVLVKGLGIRSVLVWGLVKLLALAKVTVLEWVMTKVKASAMELESGLEMETA